MTRLRYIVDRPRGPRGGNNDARNLYTWIGPAEREAGLARPSTQDQRIRWDRGDEKGVVRQVDLDELLIVRPEPSGDRLFQWHEFMTFRHEAEMLRLQPEHVRAPHHNLLTTHDIALLREVFDEWALENNYRKTPAMHMAFNVLRDLRREGKLG